MELAAVGAVQAVPFSPANADRYFASFRAKLVIEVDGSQHTEDAAIAYDSRRTRVIEAEGYAVLRLTTSDVLQHLDEVFDAVLAVVSPRK